MNSLNPAPFQTHSIGNVLAEFPRHYLNIASDEIAFVDGIVNAKMAPQHYRTRLWLMVRRFQQLSRAVSEVDGGSEL
jgi:uncharacterized protein (UPF0147 family)